MKEKNHDLGGGIVTDLGGGIVTIPRQQRGHPSTAEASPARPAGG